MRDIRWLSADNVRRINRIVVSQSEEDYLLRSDDLLEGALSRPQNRHHYKNEPDLLVSAVTLMEAISKNHCFMQGNKRTAFHAAVLFLQINGI